MSGANTTSKTCSTHWITCSIDGNMRRAKEASSGYQELLNRRRLRVACDVKVLQDTLGDLQTDIRRTLDHKSTPFAKVFTAAHTHRHHHSIREHVQRELARELLRTCRQQPPQLKLQSLPICWQDIHVV
jgi:hypothetical protein